MACNLSWNGKLLMKIKMVGSQGEKHQTMRRDSMRCVSQRESQANFGVVVDRARGVVLGLLS